MTIAAGSNILAADFVATSAGAGDAGKAPKLSSDGLLDRSLINAVKFGGTGADGALSSSSGTTTIDLGSAAVVVKNYTSISLTGTAVLAFSNPHANGTIIILKSQGNVTLTSSANPAIDIRSLGATGGAGGTQGSGTAGTAANSSLVLMNGGGRGGNFLSNGNASDVAGGVAIANTGSLTINGKVVPFAAGSGGGGGAGAKTNDPGKAGGGGGGSSLVNDGAVGLGDSTSSPSDGTGGAGGRGAGGLYIECNGALNVTCIFNGVGANGSNSASGTSGGGGGGGGGTIIILYRTLTANSGTYTLTGGTGGTAGGGHSGNGGNGGAGSSLVAANTEFA